MKHSSLRGKQRKSSMPGRKFIMAVVVLTSAFSFTLGYFVGKASQSTGSFGKEKQPQSQKIAVSFQQETQPRKSGEQAVQTNEQQVQVKEAKLSDDKALPLQIAAVKKEDNPPQPSGGEFPSEKEPKPVKNEADKENIKAVVYTVQAGAFKNLKEAENLKHRLENKGYKIYIKKYAAAKNVKLFKVRTGEFTTKQDAEDTALKLRKAEGVKAFVTFMTEAKNWK